MQADPCSTEKGERLRATLRRRGLNPGRKISNGNKPRWGSKWGRGQD